MKTFPNTTGKELPNTTIYSFPLQFLEHIQNQIYILNKDLKWTFFTSTIKIIRNQKISMLQLAIPSNLYFFLFRPHLDLDIPMTPRPHLDIPTTPRPHLDTVSAQIRGHSWLNRHASTLFSKICQLLNILFSKISP